MHDCRDDDKPTPAISEWVLPPRNGNAMLRCVSVSIDDVVFRAHEYTRRTIEPLGRRKLTAWHLYEEVSLGIRGLTPFSYNVVEAQIQFVVG
jgi:hypothetical protein